MAADSRFGGGAFDPETTSLLIAAFEKAWETVLRSGSSLAAVEHASATRELLAKYVIDRVQAGERDLKKLIDDAVAHLAAPR
jgi:hypothetical protein